MQGERIISRWFWCASPPPPQPGRGPGGPLRSLIDPRVEDATRLLELDLQGTFWFVPRGTRGTLEYERAQYTIDTLGLNKRDVLPSARRAAYKDYRAHLAQYVTVRAAGGDEAELQRLAQDIRIRQHPTVWYGMRRKHRKLPALAPLFEAAPEALAWGPPIVT